MEGVMGLFVPQHFAASAWEHYKESGYDVKLFLPAKHKVDCKTPSSAKEFLVAMRNAYISFSIEDNSSCVFAKVTAPDGNTACLRMDRDYTEIYKKDIAGRITTMACWQPANLFDGFSQQELWCNMVSLLKSNKTRKRVRPKPIKSNRNKH